MASRRWLRAAPACALACVSLAGCLGHDSSQPANQAGVILGAPTRLADCSDWNRSSFSDRLQAVKALKAFAGGAVGTGRRRGATFDDLDAVRVLGDTCKQPFAKRFRLYKLYTRAASFTKQK